MAKNDPRIDEIRHEGPGEWFVYLTPGWCIDPLAAQHCFGEDTRSAIRKTMKAVKPCQCVECQGLTLDDAIGELFAELNRT